MREGLANVHPCASMHALQCILHGEVYTPIPRLALDALPCSGGENMSNPATRCPRTRHFLSIAVVIWALTAANVWNCAALAIKINGGSMCGDGICAPPKENSDNCPLDCSPKCGDGICNQHVESYSSCPVDCQMHSSTANHEPITVDIVICGDNKCQGPQETPST